MYNGKRMRQAVTRRGVDYNASMLNWQKKRKFRRDLRDDEFVQYDLDDPPMTEGEEQAMASSRQVMSHPQGGKHLMPPSATEHFYPSSLCTRYARTSINKVRFPVTAIAMAPDGKRVITGSSSGEFTLWNAQHFNFETILQAHDVAVRSMVFSHSDEYLLSGDNGGTVKYWQPNFNCVRVLQAHDQPLRQLCFSPTDLKFTTCSDDGFVKVWDFVRGEMESSMEGHGWDVKTVDWHSSKSLIASGGKDNKVKLWDPRMGKELATIHAHKQTVLSTKWNLNGNWLLTSSRDQVSKLFDIRTMKELQVFRGHKREVTCCQWHPFHEGLFITGSGDGTVNFHQVGTELPIAKIDAAHESSIWDVAWHPFGHTVASISNDQLLRFWTRNRPGDKLDDKHNLTARQESNVDLTKLSRAVEYDAADLHGTAGKPLLDPSSLAGGLAAIAASVGAGASSSSSIIPGMSSAQAKLRRMRTQAVAPSRSSATARVELSVVTYDLLAQVNAKPAYFPGVSETFLDWSYRSQNLLLEIKQRAADVLCLQEVSQYREFWQQTLKGYQAAYQAHPDPAMGKGVVIMTRPQKLALKQAIQVRFSDEEETTRSVAVVGVYEAAAAVASKDPKAPKIMFVIASCHVSNYGNDAKQAEQLQILLNALDRAKGNCGRATVNMIVAGNFNMVPQGASYNLMISSPLGLASSFGRFASGREPAYTTLSSTWEGTTSYIFYAHSDMGIKELLEFPDKALLGPPTYLPNGDYSSNHLLMSTGFIF